MKTKIKRPSIESILVYILAISIILAGDTMYGVLKIFKEYGIISYTFRQISLVSTGFFLIYLLLKQSIKETNFILLLVVVVYFLIYLVMTRHSVMSALEGMCLPVLLYIGLGSLTRSDKLFVSFMNRFERIVVFLATMSLLFYVGGVLLNYIPAMQMQYQNNGSWHDCNNYLYLHFLNKWQYVELFGVRVYRNVGIFMEGPGFANVLLFALWWELFGYKNLRVKRIVLLIICLITTFTTKAYIFTLVLLGVFLYSKESNSIRWWKRIRKPMLPFMLIIAVFVVFYFLRQKMNSNGSMLASSWQIRVADYYAALRAWVSKPYFGVGFYNLEILYQYLPTNMPQGNPTAGFLNILAYGGIYMFIGNVIAIVSFYTRFKKTYYKSAITSFLLLLLLLLFTSAMQYSYLYLFFLSIGLTLPQTASLENQE